MIKLDQYRDTWMSQKFDEVIGFYPREFYPLDNFSSFKVKYNGYLYSSAEASYTNAGCQAANRYINLAIPFIKDILYCSLKINTKSLNI